MCLESECRGAVGVSYWSRLGRVAVNPGRDGGTTVGLDCPAMGLDCPTMGLGCPTVACLAGAARRQTVLYCCS